MSIIDTAGNEIAPPDHGSIVEFKVKRKRFERLRGDCNVVLIEKTGRGKTLGKYFEEFEPTKVMRWLNQKGYEFAVRWLHVDTLVGIDVRDIAYKWRLKNYLQEHWELPSGHDGSGGTDPESAKTIRPLELTVLPSLADTLASLSISNCIGNWSDWYDYPNPAKLRSEFTIPPIPEKPTGTWSDWYPLACSENIDRLPASDIDKFAPDSPGIYEIRLNRTFGRIDGETDLVNIGVATRSIMKRVVEQKKYGWKRYWSGSMKWIKELEPDFAYQARWLQVQGPVSSLRSLAQDAENWRIANFNLAHLEQPPGQPDPPKGWGKIRWPK